MPSTEARRSTLDARGPGAGNRIRLRAGIEHGAPPPRRELDVALLLREERDEGDLLARAPAPQHQRRTVAPRIDRLVAVVLQRRMLAAQGEQVAVPAQRRTPRRRVP